MSEHHGKVFWSELMTRDVDKAKAYYADICGYTFETVDMGEGDYHLGKLGETMTIGIMDMTGLPGMDEVPAHWLTYFAVSDVDATVAATKAAGGQIFREPFDVEGVGRIAIGADPSGAAIGLMAPS
ncbi:MAG: VOC family protein [Litoreibacter sp.]